MHLPDDIALLIEKYLNGTLSAAEKLRLNQWYGSLAGGKEASFPEGEDEAGVGARLEQRVFSTIALYERNKRSAFPRRWPLALAAASVVLVIAAVAAFYYLNRERRSGAMCAQSKPAPTDIVPAANRALLTLSDGSSIALDSASNGELSRQGNTKVLKLNNGSLSYVQQGSKKGASSQAASVNTISTPRGGQYQVVLSDGTKVWLNAASSIRFPVVFYGTERKVAITGEAYFEVARDAQKPFSVQVNNHVIEVLGTHFNVNAYNDEATVSTTLLEGSIRFRPGGNASPAVLSPGQQLSADRKGHITVRKNADTEAAVAWMHGSFQFRGADLQTVLRQVARWYDVEIEYKGNIDLHFTGQLPRGPHVQSVLDKLILTGEMHYKMEGRKIIVSP